MTKEYMGLNAVKDLFDIIDENFVSKEDFEKREKEIASALCVGSALISKCLLKMAEAIIIAKGAAGGEDMENELIATNSEVDEVLGKYFNNGNSNNETENTVNNNSVATDDEVDDVLGKYF